MIGSCCSMVSFFFLSFSSGFNLLLTSFRVESNNCSQSNEVILLIFMKTDELNDVAPDQQHQCALQSKNDFFSSSFLLLSPINCSQCWRWCILVQCKKRNLVASMAVAAEWQMANGIRSNKGIQFDRWVDRGLTTEQIDMNLFYSSMLSKAESPSFYLEFYVEEGNQVIVLRMKYEMFLWLRLLLFVIHVIIKLPTLSL